MIKSGLKDREFHVVEHEIGLFIIEVVPGCDGFYRTPGWRVKMYLRRNGCPNDGSEDELIQEYVDTVSHDYQDMWFEANENLGIFICEFDKQLPTNS